MDDNTAYRLALRATALAYVAQGWRVIPLAAVTYDGDGRKTIKPLIKWQREPDSVVTTPAQVERWFGLTGQAQGLAIATGAVLAVDLDEYKAGYAGVELPTGGWLEQHTGRGGGHVYLSNPDGQRNTAGGLGAGVDTRGDGGLSVAAPTRCYHADGRITQWQAARPVSELPRPEHLPAAPPPAARRAQRERSAPGTATPVTPEAAAFSVARARDEWLACVRGTRHETLIRYFAVLVRYRLAQGAEVSELIGELEAAALEHPDARAGEEFESVDGAISWAVDQARATPWRLQAAEGFDARFAPPDPGEAPAGQDFADWGEDDDPDALTDEDYDGEWVAPVPGLLDLGGSIKLLYQGDEKTPRANILFGAPGCGKTWLALTALVQLAESGQRCWYVDYENSRPELVARMKALGLSRAGAKRVTYTRASMEEPRALHERMKARGGRYGLMVLDGWNAALRSMGVDENSTGEVTGWYQRWVVTIPTVLILDHVAKNADGFGPRTAIGSQAKSAVLSGIEWFVEKVRGFGTKSSGALRLTHGKDRPGGIDGRFVDGRVLVEVKVADGGHHVRLAIPMVMGEPVSEEETMFSALYADGVTASITEREFMAAWRERDPAGRAPGKGRIAAVLARWRQYWADRQNGVTPPDMNGL